MTTDERDGLDMAKMHIGALEELGIIPPPSPCRQCSAATEHWWSYCAMCGYYIAGGAFIAEQREVKS